MELINTILDLLINYNENFKYTKLMMNKLFFSIFKVLNKVNLFI